MLRPWHNYVSTPAGVADTQDSHCTLKQGCQQSMHSHFQWPGEVSTLTEEDAFVCHIFSISFWHPSTIFASLVSQITRCRLPRCQMHSSCGHPPVLLSISHGLEDLWYLNASKLYTLTILVKPIITALITHVLSGYFRNASKKKSRNSLIKLTWKKCKRPQCSGKHSR